MARLEFVFETVQHVVDFARSVAEGPAYPRPVITSALMTTMLIVLTAIRSYVYERRQRE